MERYKVMAYPAAHSKVSLSIHQNIALLAMHCYVSEDIWVGSYGNIADNGNAECTYHCIHRFPPHAEKHCVASYIFSDVAVQS